MIYMIKTRQNDLCACGSGKKFKRCCGNKTVVSLDLLIENELFEIQHDLLHFAMKNYYEIIVDYLKKCFEEFDIPDDAMELFHFYACTWFISSVELEGKTILEEYIDRHIHTYSRQRIKDILQSWKQVRPSVSMILDQGENHYLTVQDIFTKEVIQVKTLEEDHNVQNGGIILATILPAGATSIIFTTFLDLHASETEGMANLLVNQFMMSEYENPVDFMATNFLHVLDTLLFGKANFSIADLDWSSSKHKEVAGNYQGFMEQLGHDQTIISIGIFLWSRYCSKRNPTIKKTNVYEAALVYLVDKLIPYEGLLTQKELADVFHISSSSISSKYKDFETVLAEEIKDFEEEVSEFELADFFKDGIFN